MPSASTRSRPGGRGPALSLVGAAVALVLAGCSSASSVYVGPVGQSSASATGPSASASPKDGPVVPGQPGVGRFITLRTGELERRFWIHLPLTAPQGPRPVVIAYHDSGSSATGLARDSGIDGAADRNGVIVVFPDAVGGRWSSGQAGAVRKNGGVDDVAFTRDILAALPNIARVDLKRVVVTGIGDGALMALRFAAERPTDVTGVVAIQGGLVSGPTPTVPKTPMSVAFIRGNADPSLPSDGLPERTNGGPQLGMQQTLDTYLRLDGLLGATPTESVLMPDRDPGDGTRVRRTTWGPGTAGRTVTLYLVDGGGGPFPGGAANTRDFASIGRVTRDLSAASVIVRFALEVRQPA